MVSWNPCQGILIIQYTHPARSVKRNVFYAVSVQVLAGQGHPGVTFV